MARGNIVKFRATLPMNANQKKMANDFIIRTLLERNREVKNIIAIGSNYKYLEKSK